jgi:hypothetical protein
MNVPPPETILAGLATIANDWRWLAITWHMLLGALLVLLLGGWRPSARLMGQLLCVPLLSVSGMAWLSGNPFNGTTFAVLATVLGAMTAAFPTTTVRFNSPALVGLGAVSIVFGWTYPHFTNADSWTTYLYASPFGVLPCPTLAAVIGITVVVSSLGSTAWSATLAGAGLVYGVIGVLRLDVALDSGLLLASVVLVATVARERAGWRSVRADQHEQRRGLPGDHFISQPMGTLTHAITVERPPHAVWPWLIQMGAGTRAGWYSYDVLDNRGTPSAVHLVPALQHIAVGTVCPALPGVTEGFTVLAFEPRRFLILAWPGPSGEPLVTWSFVLEERGGDTTRLIVRARAGQGYRFRGLPSWMSMPIARLVHFVMERKQLLGIARRVEYSS